MHLYVFYRTDDVNPLHGDLDGGHNEDNIKPNFEKIKFEDGDADNDTKYVDDADTDADTADELDDQEQEQQVEESQLKVEEPQLKDRSESGSKKKGKISMWMSPFRGIHFLFVKLQS